MRVQGVRYTAGRLEVITGPMFAGKSEELFRRLRRATIARERVLAARPDTDARSRPLTATSHDGREIAADVVGQADPGTLTRLVNDREPQVVGLDEVQFLDESYSGAISALVARGMRVIVAGLDMDFRGVPFGISADLMALADDVSKLSAICVRCGQPGMMTQRMTGSRPASRETARILVGGEDRYEARCRSCHEVWA